MAKATASVRLATPMLETEMEWDAQPTLTVTDLAVGHFAPERYTITQETQQGGLFSVASAGESRTINATLGNIILSDSRAAGSQPKAD